jgi:predicted MPP superfamily phosphohydrolase
MGRMPLTALSALLHAYIGWRILPALTPWPIAQVLLLIALASSAVLIPLGWLLRRRIASQQWADALAWGSLVCLGLFSSLFVLTLLRDVLLVLTWIVTALMPMPGLIDRLVVWTGVAVPLAGAAITLWGFLNARRTPSTVSVDVPIAGLPAALEGFTIAQISDLHVGPTIRRDYVEAIVRAVNGLQADMVAVTGDLVDGSVADLAQHVAPMAALSSRHGTYFVTGNHEYYSGVRAWIAHLQRLGMRVLMNEHVVLRHDGAPLVVAGVTDYGAHHFDAAQRSDPQAAIAGAPSDASTRVLLAHQPRSAAAAAQAGFALQLSGHTHGGQFWPWNFFVPLQQPFTAGLHRLHNLWVYTSRGTGYWGPPKRFGAPSEITRLRLVRAAP